jgi:DNA-binding GntR family transcriptional regulator
MYTHMELRGCANPGPLNRGKAGCSSAPVGVCRTVTRDSPAARCALPAARSKASAKRASHATVRFRPRRATEVVVGLAPRFGVQLAGAHLTFTKDAGAKSRKDQMSAAPSPNQTSTLRANARYSLGRLEHRTTTAAAAADVLKSAILDGTLPMGSQLLETHLAADLGISRAPLREALGMLAEDGVVVKVPFRGTFVAEVSPRAIAEITSLRLRLEPYAIELALPRLKGEGRELVEAAIAEMARGADEGDNTATIAAHAAFHRAFYDLANHDLLLSVWSSWETQLQLFFSADHRAFGDLHDVAAAHEHMLAVIDTHDLDAITREVAVHIEGPLPGRHDR